MSQFISMLALLLAGAMATSTHEVAPMAHATAGFKVVVDRGTGRIIATPTQTDLAALSRGDKIERRRSMWELRRFALTHGGEGVHLDGWADVAFATQREGAVDAQAATVRGTLRRNPDLRAGADSDNRVLLYTPRPFDPGSTHSHFDTSASPNLLMEPGINADLAAFDVDLTKQALQDMGWPLGGFNVDVTYSDAASQGFQDPLLGAQRRSAFEAAAEAWGLILGSTVTVHIEARFLELDCDEDGGTLASAGPQFAFRDFAGSEPGVWYSGALAEALAGANLSTDDVADPTAADLRVTFNQSIDEECLGEGTRFYYGLNGREPAGEIAFIAVAMHELAHGLGFVGLLDARSGALFQGLPDIFTTLTYDTKKRKHWDEMTQSARKKSARRGRKVSFDGPRTTARAQRYLKGKEVLEISAPADLAGSYEIGTASFGPQLKPKGVSGELVLVDDGSAKPTFACQPIQNGAEVSGALAVIDRGDCFFTEKVKNAQNAGAIGAIIIHNEAGLPPPLGGSDPSIRIPSVRISRAAGRKIKRELRQ